MPFLNKIKILAPGIFLLSICILVSCEPENPLTLGEDVVGDKPFGTGSQVYDVFAYNKNIVAVQTNRLPLYQLGEFMDPVFGNTQAQITAQLVLSGGNGDPVFGNYAQSVEDKADTDGNDSTIDEDERVEQVHFYIPFLVEADELRDRDGDGVDNEFDADPDDANSHSDKDGLTDIEERSTGTDPLNSDTDGDGIPDDLDDDTVANIYPKRYALDSIYGDRTQPYRIKIQQSDYYLRDLDPDASFLEAQEYYSSQDFTPFLTDVLVDKDTLVFNEDLVTLKEDDPDTEDIDESEEVDTRLTPGIYVSLDKDFFQANLLDKEGSSELLNQSNFQDFIRGINIQVSGDLAFTLNLTQARIIVKYSYAAIEDSEEVRNTKTYELGVMRSASNTSLVRNGVNTMVSGPYPQQIADSLDTGKNASRIYLKGGAGIYAEIKLFDESNGKDAIKQIREKKWIINEANLVFHVDRNTLDMANDSIEPPRLYLYNADNKSVIYNALNEVNDEGTSLGVLPNFDGVLQKTADKGTQYRIRITDHINDLVVRDSANATLGLSLTADIRDPRISNAVLANGVEDELPIMATTIPMGTVLYGSNVNTAEADKKLQLEIIYTEVD